jgi:fatty-acyl-CoA synthase
MQSTMPDLPLTVNGIFEHGRKFFADSRVAAYSSAGVRRATFAEVAEEADRLAVGLQRLGIGPGDRVGTFCWNHVEHLAAYFAVPCMGSVLHTLNIRLFAEQLAYVINHGEDRVVIVDASLADKVAEVADQLTTVEHCIVIGDGEVPGLPGEVLRYEDVLAEAGAAPEWPEIDERDAASMCYTSGTTGNPRGVAYGHRSTFVHALAQCSGNGFALSEADTILMIVPMFHANAWGLPYSGWMVGADMVMPGELLQAAPLARIVADEQPTFTGAVPTIYNDLLQYGEREELDLSCLRLARCGGAPVPASLIEAMRDRHGVPMLQGWGMTETSPLAALARPPKGSPPEEDTFWRTKSGKPIAGVQMRLVDEEGRELPWDGESVGEIEVRGPWVTTSYYNEDTPEKFRDGWLRTGDVGYGDRKGFVQLTDRTKDVIKTGGEWISSVELENVLMSHPDIVEAAVVAVPDPRWDERPLACVVLREGASLDADTIRAWLDGRVARFWLPERWAFIDEVPKTSVGKFDKKVLRTRYAEDALEVTVAGQSGAKA